MQPAFDRSQDFGRGIDKADVNRIFDPFFTTKDVGQGVGLGLHFVRSTAEQSGGEINVQSTPEQGSTFTLTLPRFKARPISRATAV